MRRFFGQLNPQKVQQDVIGGKKWLVQKGRILLVSSIIYNLSQYCAINIPMFSIKITVSDNLSIFILRITHHPPNHHFSRWYKQFPNGWFMVFLAHLTVFLFEWSSCDVSTRPGVKRNFPPRSRDLARKSLDQWIGWTIYRNTPYFEWENRWFPAKIFPETNIHWAEGNTIWKLQILQLYFV